LGDAVSDPYLNFPQAQANWFGTSTSVDPRRPVITGQPLPGDHTHIIIAPISYFTVMLTSRKVDALERAFIPLFIANRVSWSLL
jgi:hypothetical protein